MEPRFRGSPPAVLRGHPQHLGWRAGRCIDTSHLTDTWEWDGTHWNRRVTDNVTPARRALAALTYDSVRNVALLFGGVRCPARYLNDTWTWDGREWTRLPVDGPPAGKHVALAFDEQRGVAVLFIALDHTSETWEWDGSAWSRRASGGPPPGACAMIYDPDRSRALLVTVEYSGIRAWTWDGAAWSEDPRVPMPVWSFPQAPVLTWQANRHAALLVLEDWYDLGAISTWELARNPCCDADFNRDCDVDGHDLADFLDAFFAGDAAADITRDGTVDSDDHTAFVNLYLAGC